MFSQEMKEKVKPAEQVFPEQHEMTSEAASGVLGSSAAIATTDAETFRATADVKTNGISTAPTWQDEDV